MIKGDFSMEQRIVLSAFSGSTDMERIECAMHWLADHPGSELIIEPGVYTITSSLAKETMERVLSGDFGANPQPVMFSPHFAYSRGMSLAGQKNTRISAYGALFLVDGFMEPVSVIDCENVELCGLTIDYKRKPYSYGTITSVKPIERENGIFLEVEVSFGKDFPLQPQTPCSLRDRFYDPDTDRYLCTPKFDFTVLDSFHCRMLVKPDSGVRVRMQYYTIHTYHFRPAILIERAKGITLTDVKIHAQPGMGIVGNRCEDILLRRLSVIPSPGQHWSTNTDATHFTSVKGFLRYEDCHSKAHGDDFINVHAYYQDIIEILSPCTCIMQEKTPDGTHAQTLDYPDVGDVLELVDRNTLLTKDTFTVLSCIPMEEKWCCRVELDHPLPADTKGLMLADITRLPRVEISGCRIQSHCARGILIKSRDVLLEKNYFRHCEGPAIEIAAEAYWSEGVCPHNVTIRENRIEQCGVLTKVGGILVISDAPHACCQSMYNIVIEDNFIDAQSNEHAVFVRNVDGLTMQRNQILGGKHPIAVSECQNVNIVHV